ncbi:MAG TPA: DUF5693 family protein [Halanaerobiales bacterium]|nr:DUF5693 family protein [Halanaerobiales bacterium]
MNKKILYLVIILTLIVSVIGIRGRMMVEQSNSNVEMAFDYKSLTEMKKEYNNQTLSIEELKSYGINSIAISPLDIKKLVKLGKVAHLTNSEIQTSQLLSDSNDAFWEEFPLENQSAFLIFDSKNNFYNNLFYYKEDFNLSFKEVKGKNVVFFPYWQEDYFSLDLGFDRDLIKEIKDSGLNVVYRFDNLTNNDLNFHLLSTLSTDATIVFAGQEILGYSDEIEKTAQIMQENNNTFGFIEAIIGVQKGEDKLAKKLNYEIVRVHSITQEEMNIYAQSKIVDRYMRAVKERNIRFFYMRPIIKENKDFAEVKSLNTEYIDRLKERLVSAGYNISKAEPYQPFSNSSIYLIFTSLGILAGGVLLLIEIFKIKEELLQYILIVLGIIGIFLTYFFLDLYFFRTGLALGSSIIFPSLAVIAQLLRKSKVKNIFNYIKAALITLSGAVFIVSALADISYLTKINQFRGVKLAFIMPLLIITFYYFMEYIVREKDTTIKDKLFELLDVNLKLKHLIILGFIGLAGIYYILRTGNFPILDIPAIEERFRVILEDLLYVRPRFKEFLIGHPAFIIALYYFTQLKKNYGLYFLGLLAVIGQLNILNSFAHIHTPVLISLLRTIHGLWLGLVLGLIAVVVIKYFLNFVNKQKVK